MKVGVAVLGSPAAPTNPRDLCRERSGFCLGVCVCVCLRWQKQWVLCFFFRSQKKKKKKKVLKAFENKQTIAVIYI